jgi:uncharacterized membrane protein YhaH (DUF805 family)
MRVAFRDPLAAYNAASNLEAHLVCDLLLEAGIDALVIEDVSQAGTWLGGMTPEIHKPQVWIERADADRAAPVLAEYERKLAERQDDTGEGIQVTCEECGKRSTFPAAMRGLVETCWHCGEYVDVEPDRGPPTAEHDPSSASAPPRDPATSDNPYLAPTADYEGPQEPQADPNGLISFLWYRGRITRTEWWIVRFGFVALIYALDGAIKAELLEGWAETPILCVACWPLLVSDIKRWHDHGRSGWWTLIYWILCIGPLLALLMLGFQRGTPGPNRYGPDPLGEEAL